VGDVIDPHERPVNPFAELMSEMVDGKRWQLLRSTGWDDFVHRLTLLVGELEPRRRQALLMLLFAMVDRQLDPDQAQAWLEGHDTDSEAGLEVMIAWLRSFRPPPSEVLPGEDETPQ
jgi:hypothetical protein